MTQDQNIQVQPQENPDEEKEEFFGEVLERRYHEVEEMIDNGVDVTANDNYAVTLAARNKDIEMLILLCKNGADLEAENNFVKKYLEEKEINYILSSVNGTELEKTTL